MEPGRQFSMIMQAVPKGMEYQRAGNGAMRRLAVVDPQEPIKQAQHAKPNPQDYYSPKVNQTRKADGTLLKKPKVSDNPMVSTPHTVAFADFHDQSVGDNKSLYVDYVNSRQRGHGHASRLINQIAQMHPEHEIDFGRVMNEGIWKVKEGLEAQGRTTRGKRDF